MRKILILVVIVFISLIVLSIVCTNWQEENCEKEYYYAIEEECINYMAAPIVRCIDYKEVKVKKFRYINCNKK